MEDLRGPTSPPPTAPSPGSPGDPAQDRAVEEGHSVGLYGHRSQMSHQSSPRSSLPGGGAVERLGPKAWGGAGVLAVSCHRNQHPSCFTPQKKQAWKLSRGAAWGRRLGQQTGPGACPGPLEYPLPWLKVGVEESPHLPGQCETGHTEEALVGRCEDQPSSHGQGRRGPKAWSGPGDQTWSVPGRCPAGLFWVPQNMTYIITADAGTESGRL